MSTATKTAIVARMEADSALMALLATDPNDPTGKALFNARMSDAPPVYDCITFRESTEVPDGRFRPGLPGGTSATVYDEYYDFEVWTQKPSSKPIDAIRKRLDANLHQVAFATSEGRVIWSERITAQPDLYDKDLNARYGLSRYRLRIEIPAP